MLSLLTMFCRIGRGGCQVLQDNHNSAQCNNHEASLSLAFMKSISVIQATNLWE